METMFRKKEIKFIYTFDYWGRKNSDTSLNFKIYDDGTVEKNYEFIR